MARRKASESSSSSSSSSESSSSSSSDTQKKNTKKQTIKKRSTNNDKVKPNKTLADVKKKSSESKTTQNRRSRSPKHMSKKDNTTHRDKRHKSEHEDKRKSEKKSDPSKRHSETVEKTSKSQPKSEDKSTKEDKFTKEDKPTKEDKSTKEDKPTKDDKSTKEDKKKNLFPIVNKDEVTVSVEDGMRHITETTLVSYPNLNSSVAEEKSKKGRDDGKKRRNCSPERFKSLSSTITVKHNAAVPDKSEKRLRRDRTPPPRDGAPTKDAARDETKDQSLRERVGWDPFKTDNATFGDHDDRQFSHGYNDSYTRKDDSYIRKDFGRGRGGFRAGFRAGFRGGFRGGFRNDFRADFRRERTFQSDARRGMWTNNRNFNNRNTDNTVDRSGINDSKWKRDKFDAC